MHITLIAVGKIKTSYWVAAQKEYLERARRYATVDLVEVKDRVGQGEPDVAACEKEGNDILKAASGIPGLISLHPAGTLFSSPDWSKALRHWTETYSRVAFVIGGPVGLSDAVLKKSTAQLSLSPMTFPHEMARIVFLEQLYRAFSLQKGEKYHK